MNHTITAWLPAPALRPTGNIQGNFYFFTVCPQVVSCYKSTCRHCITHACQSHVVHLLARRQKANPGLFFLNRQRQPFDDDEPDDDESDDDDDDDYVPHDSDNDDEDEDYVPYDCDGDDGDNDDDAAP